MKNETFLTAAGAARLKKELAKLIDTDRKELAKRLRAAIQQGDLSENADYHKAKEDQAFLEGRIQELEHLLKTATIVEHNADKKDIIAIGSKVTVQEEDFPPDTYLLVGAKEADPRSGRISYESPIGQALLDHRIDDMVEIETPGGKIKLKILKIE